jgi:hypothetical protein
VKITSKYDIPAYEALLNAERGGTSMGFTLKIYFLGSRGEYEALCGRMNKKHYGAVSTCLSHSNDCFLLC